jgi:hypothetical protein
MIAETERESTEEAMCRGETGVAAGVIRGGTAGAGAEAMTVIGTLTNKLS